MHSKGVTGEEIVINAREAGLKTQQLWSLRLIPDQVNLILFANSRRRASLAQRAPDLARRSSAKPHSSTASSQ